MKKISVAPFYTYFFLNSTSIGPLSASDHGQVAVLFTVKRSKIPVA